MSLSHALSHHLFCLGPSVHSHFHYQTLATKISSERPIIQQSPQVQTQCGLRTAMNTGHRHEPSSSFDSADAGSPHHGTPDTKSTALSPEEFRQGITTQSSTTTNQPPAFLLGAVPPRGLKSATIAYHDPFVTSKLGQSAGYPRDSSKNKLSPIAPAFTPLALGGDTGENIVSSTLMVPNDPSRGTCYSPGSLQSSPLPPETPNTQTCGELCSPGAQRQPMKSGNFSSDSFVSRSVVVSHIDVRTPAADIESLISVSPPTFKLAEAGRS